MTFKTITALHLYNPNEFSNVVRKMQPALKVSDSLWIATSNPLLLERIELFSASFSIPVRVFEVSNTWHDWSGFLAFLSAADPACRLIIANDSISTRRVLSARSVNSVVKVSQSRIHALVGELDIAPESVIIQRESSVCWISTYLFALSGIQVNTDVLEQVVCSDVDQILNAPDHFFHRYLVQRRPSLVRQPDLLKAKLGAMCFERHLTRIAIAQGADIVHAFAGNRLRKLERLLERMRDA